MTQEEWLKKNRTAIDSLIKNNRPLNVASRAALQNVASRIFEQGKKSDGSDIGQYDTKRPMYVNPLYSPLAKGNKKIGLQGLTPTTGKTGEHLFKNGKPHKTTYVKNYKDFRNRIGRRIDKVNLVLTGDLQSDFANGKVSNPIPKKVSTHEYVVTLSRQSNQDKREGLEKKYGTIFFHTKGEVAKFIKIAGQELRNEFTKLGLK